MTAPAIFVFCFLLALPGYAVSRLGSGFDWRILAGTVFTVSAVTFLVYRHDKRQAGAGGSRMPEATLHLLELLGGWPGAFLAQRVFRHKNAKFSFQAVFWTIVLLHQFIALDSLLDWRLTREAIRAVRSV